MAVTSEELKQLAFTINNAVGKAVQAGAKAVIIPERQKFLSEIKKDIETGQIEKVENVVEKLTGVIDEMGENFEDWQDILTNDVAKNLKELVKQKQSADVESKQLQQQNLPAVTRLVEKNNEITYKTVLLTNKEIKERNKEIYREQKQLIKDEKELQRDIKTYQQGPVDEEKSQALLERKEKIEKRKEDLKEKVESVGDKKDKKFLDELLENIPDTFKDMFSSFKDTLMAPIQAVKNLGKVLGDMGKGIVKVVKLFGTLAKGLGRLVMSVMATIGSFLLAALPFIAIGAAIIALGYGLYKLGQKLGIFDKEPEFRSKAEEQKFTEVKGKLDTGKELTAQDELFIKANPELAKYGGQKMEDIATKETQKYEEIQNRGGAGDLAGEAAMIYDDDYAKEFKESDKLQKERIQRFKEGQQILFDKGYSKGNLIEIDGVQTDLKGFKNLIMEDAISDEQIKGATVVNVDNSKTDNSNKSGTNITTGGVVTDPSLDSMYSTASP